MLYTIMQFCQSLTCINSFKTLAKADIMMKYMVRIVETLTMIVEVEAPSMKEAVNYVEKKYWKEEIVVESNTGANVKFTASPVK